MTVDLERQLSDYGEHVQSLIVPVDVRDVVVPSAWETDGGESARHRGVRRLMGVAAAVLVLLLIGGVALLAGLFGDEHAPVIDSPTTVTTQAAVTPEITTPAPETTATTSIPETSVTQALPGPPPEGKIAFISDPDGVLGGLDQELVVINADGTGRKFLADVYGGGDPVWSPDGTSLLFGSLVNGDTQTFIVGVEDAVARQLTDIMGAGMLYAWSPDGSLIALNGNDRLYVMKADGSDLIQLSDQVSGAGRPVWSPDGNRIAFEADNNGPSRDLYVIDADGSNLTQLTDLAESISLSRSSWSPDSDRILFTVENAGTRDLYLIDVDGANLIQLTDLDEQTSLKSGVWSPDGGRILYGTSITVEETLNHPEGTELHQYLMTPNGSDIQELGLGDYGEGIWSPDGDQIAFRDLWDRLSVFSLSGSTMTHLTEELLLHPNYPLAWSPAGTHIAFSAALTRDESTANYDIYVAAADGSGVTRLTTEPGNDVELVWSPTP